jgi:hypothetical protein
MPSCNKCRTVKPPSEFYRSKAKRGHQAMCKTCWDERSREYRRLHWGSCYATRQRWRERNRARAAALTRKSALKNRYGITPDEYDLLFARQHGKCAICSIAPSRGRLLCVDHCHATAAVRALLCDKCNRGIGAFRDDPALMIAAARYVSRHRGLSCARN